MRIEPRDIALPQALLAGLVLVLCVAVVWAASTSAAAFGAYNPAWDGSSEARAFAASTGAEPVTITSVDQYGAVDPSTTTAIVLAPERPYEPAALDRIRGFVRGGGTLVVASDFGREGNRLLTGLNATTRIDGRLLRDDRRYSRSSAMPLANSVTTHRFTRNVSVVALNHASVVTRTNESGVTVLVRSSAFGYLDTNRNGRVDNAESLGRYPVATVESVGDGTVVVISDPSVFINAMFDRGDNRAFARALVGPSSTVLFDYSHSGGLPPLTYAMLVLRRSPLMTIALTGVVVGVLALVARGDRGPRISGGRDGPSVPPVALTEGEIVAFLEQRHPEWEPDRRERIADRITADFGADRGHQRINTRGRQGGSNE